VSFSVEDRNVDAEEGNSALPSPSATPAVPWSVPPVHVALPDRIELSGAWNDLANCWYARGEWELAIECFRRALYWNPEQTAALLNLASLLSRLGFERDAAIVMAYYSDVRGGTMGGWDEDRENVLRRSIRDGLALAETIPGANGETLGELRLSNRLHLLQNAPAQTRRVLRAVLDSEDAAVAFLTPSIADPQNPPSTTTTTNTLPPSTASDVPGTVGGAPAAPMQGAPMQVTRVLGGIRSRPPGQGLDAYAMAQTARKAALDAEIRRREQELAAARQNQQNQQPPLQSILGSLPHLPQGHSPSHPLYLHDVLPHVLALAAVAFAVVSFARHLLQARAKRKQR
jgi:tetratricopeptide (TPR) repeat protein